MSYRDKPRIWKVATFILEDEGPRALPIGEPIVQSQKKGSKAFVEWAIDVRRCAPDHHHKAIDEHYLQPSNEYRRIPNHLRPILRMWWNNIRLRRLHIHGQRVVSVVYGDASEK